METLFAEVVKELISAPCFTCFAITDGITGAQHLPVQCLTGFVLRASLGNLSSHFAAFGENIGRGGRQGLWQPHHDFG